jgi:hypothetical protein
MSNDKIEWSAVDQTNLAISGEINSTISSPTADGKLIKKAAAYIDQQKLEKLEIIEILNKAQIFIDDVMPQIGGLCIQDFGNLNKACMGLTKYCTPKDKPNVTE